MEFLTGCETFLGTILTLAVLCIFFEQSSNFVLNLLASQKEDFMKNLNERKDNSKLRIDKFKKTKEFQYAKNIADHNPDKEISEQLLRLKNEADSLIFTFDNDINASEVNLAIYESKMDNIKNSTEHLRAPLFTLFYGLLIFLLQMFNEFLNVQFSSLLIIGVWILTILASVYWVTIWTAFILRTITSGRIIADSTSSRFWKWMDRTCKCYWGAFIKISLGILLLLIYLKWVSPLIKCNDLNSWLTVVISVLPIIAFGVSREIACERHGKYSIRHVIGHLLAMMIYTAIVMTVIYYLSSFENRLHLWFLTRELNATIIVFCLLNGVFLPFLVPYLKFNSQYNQAQNKLKENEKGVTKAIQSFKTGYNNWMIKFGEDSAHNFFKSSS